MIDVLDIELDPRSVIAKHALELMSEGRIGDDLNMENVIGVSSSPSPPSRSR